MNEELLTKLKSLFQIEFANTDFLKEAFTHSSYVNEHRELNLKDNERIEFLGDAVLELTVTKYLFNEYPSLPEGKLTRLRAAIVCEASLSQFAKEYGFDRYILLGKGEERMNGRKRPSLLCDLFESFIGALYLDQGLDGVINFLNQTVFPRIKSGAFSHVMDHKTNLQEFLQRNGEVSIDYVLIEEVGPAHEKEFLVEVLAEGNILGQGKGKSKKAAEQIAAANALENLREANEIEEIQA